MSGNNEEQLRFSEGERILCFHGPLIYEAKIQKVDTKNKQTKYLIHYHGWNKNWDEWVPEARMLKYTELNLEKKRDLVKAHEANVRAKKTKWKSDTPGALNTNVQDSSIKDAKQSKVEEATSPVVSQQPPRKAKNKKKDEISETSNPVVASTSNGNSSKQEDLKPPDNTVENEEQFHTKVEVKIKIPDELKPYLVDDWDYLTRQRKLVILPSRVTVDQVINDYVKSKTCGGRPKTTDSTQKENAILEVTAGLKEYFDIMLGSQLLYKFEREQHADILKEHPNTSMSKIYGPIHLLRLFVKLGGMLTYTPLDDKSIQLLLFYIHDFLLYIKKNVSNLFKIEDYGTAPPEYHRRAL